jgi:hypothetical protein
MKNARVRSVSSRGDDKEKTASRFDDSDYKIKNKNDTKETNIGQYQKQILIGKLLQQS